MGQEATASANFVQFTGTLEYSASTIGHAEAPALDEKNGQYHGLVRRTATPRVGG